MNYEPPSYDQGVEFYRKGENYQKARNIEAAKENYSMALQIFEMCKHEHPQALEKYNETRIALGNLR